MVGSAPYSTALVIDTISDTMTTISTMANTTRPALTLGLGIPSPFFGSGSLYISPLRGIYNSLRRRSELCITLLS